MHVIWVKENVFSFTSYYQTLGVD